MLQVYCSNTLLQLRGMGFVRTAHALYAFWESFPEACGADAGIDGLLDELSTAGVSPEELREKSGYGLEEILSLIHI